MKPRDSEVERIARLLKSAILLSHQSQRAIERQMGLSPGYLGRIIEGRLELRVSHILGVCKAIGLPPAGFFLAAYPEALSLPAESMSLVHALQHLHSQREEKVPEAKEAAAPPPAAGPDRARVEQTMKNFLDVLFGELTKTPAAAGEEAPEPKAAAAGKRAKR